MVPTTATAVTATAPSPKASSILSEGPSQGTIESSWISELLASGRTKVTGGAGVGSASGNEGYDDLSPTRYVSIVVNKA
ncbi:hypothetical protein BG015_003761, partial [Linnemannia schmuckeri]